ncbi:MAG: hypothetical protein ACTSQY_07375 [Candidatus Odinarchaeia archaeon]
MEKEDIWPYIMILPKSKKELKVLFNSLFKSDIPLEIITLFKNEDEKLYQSKIIKSIKEHSNKSVITHLNQLVNAKILESGMEKIEINTRKFWVRWFKLTKIGRYIQLLFNMNVSETEISEKIKELFYFYVYKIIKIGKKYNINDVELRHLFEKALIDSMREKNNE